MKIQALAVAAASLAVAAPALPAQARDANIYLRSDLRAAAAAHCSALSRGSAWSQAVEASRQGQLGHHWYPIATRIDNREGGNVWRQKLIKLIQRDINALCPSLEARAWARHKANKGRTPTYTGGNTTISEDPFKF